MYEPNGSSKESYEDQLLKKNSESFFLVVVELRLNHNNNKYNLIYKHACILYIPFVNVLAMYKG